MFSAQNPVNLTNVGNVLYLSNLITTQGNNVRIGTPTTPDIQYYFNGNANVVGNLYVGNLILRDAVVASGNSNVLGNLGVGGNAFVTGNLNVDNGTFYVDALNNRVGILNTNPQKTLDVSGEVNISGNVAVDTSIFFVDTVNNKVGINTTTPTYILDVNNGNLRVGALTSTQSATITTTASAASYGFISEATSTTQRTHMGFRNGNGEIGNIYTIGRDLAIFGGANGSNILIGGANLNIGGGNVYYDSLNGLLGIRNRTPLHALDVKGNANVAGNMMVSSNLTVNGGTLFVDSVGGRVGVNKTSPVFDLDVVGNANITGNTVLNGNLVVTSNLVVDTNTLYVDSVSNRVGIRTSVPGYELDVGGNVNFTGTLYQNGTPFSTGVSSQWTSGVGNAFIYYNSGNVGIGTSLPLSLLDVNGNANISGNVLARANANVFGNLGITGNLIGTSNLILLGAGNVGLGITNPAYKLDVAGVANISTGLLVGGNANVSGNLGVNGNIIGTSNLILLNGNLGIGITNPAFRLDVAGNANISARLLVGGNANVSGNLGVTGNILGTSNLILLNGNLGVGITNPAYKLDVAGVANISTQILVGGNANVSGNLGVTGNLDVTGNILGTSNLILLNGNIGLGITNPAYKLDVAGVANVSIGLLVGGNANVLGNLGVTANLIANSNLILLNGNLGIGITNPAYKLDVAGSANISANLFVGGNANILGNLGVTRNLNVVGQANLLNTLGVSGNLNTEANLIVSGNANVIGNLVVSGSSSFAAVSTLNLQVNGNYSSIGQTTLGNGNDSTKIRINCYVDNFLSVGYPNAALSGANVTGTNGSLLDCNGNIYARDYIIGNVGILSNGNANIFGNLGILGNIYGSSNLIIAGYEVVNGNANVSGNLGVVGNIIGTSNLIILGGNLGIGTSSPQYRLDVIGNANISGNIFTSNLFIRRGAFLESGDFVVSVGNVSVGNTLTVTGTSTLNGNLTVYNSETFTYGNIYNYKGIYINKNGALYTGTETVGLHAFYMYDTTTSQSTLFGGADDTNKVGYFDVRGYGGGLPLILNRSGGNVGVGTGTPAVQLDLSTDGARKLTTTTWATGSDERIKENIIYADLIRCYNIVANIPLHHYKWKDEIAEVIEDKSMLGWIAQEVEAYFPKAVTKSAEHGLIDFRTLNADQMYKVMYGALQRTMQKCEEHERVIRELVARIALLEN